MVCAEEFLLANKASSKGAKEAVSLNPPWVDITGLGGKKARTLVGLKAGVAVFSKERVREETKTGQEGVDGVLSTCFFRPPSPERRTSSGLFSQFHKGLSTIP